MAERQKSEYAITSVNHALDILERLQGGMDESGFNELLTSIKVTKNYLRRLLGTLEKHYLIETSLPSKRYRLGVSVLKLARSCNKQSRLQHSIRPVLTALSNESGEASCLAVMKDNRIVITNVVESRHPVRVAYEVGTLLPVSTFAAGKVHLAGMNPESLKCDLRQVVNNGYALDREESDKGVVSIGAPIWGHTGTVVGAICIYGPVGRFGEDRLNDVLVPLVTKAAQTVSGKASIKNSAALPNVMTSLKCKERSDMIYNPYRYFPS